MLGAATCSNAAMGTSLRCRKEKTGVYTHWLPEKTPLE